MAIPLPIPTALNWGLNGILLTSGKKALSVPSKKSAALSSSPQEKLSAAAFYDIISQSGMHVAVYDKNTECRYKSFSPNDTFFSPVTVDLKSYEKNIFLHKEGTVLKKYHNNLWKIRGKTIERGRETYCVFYLSPSVSLEHIDDEMFYIKNPLLTSACNFASFFDTSDYIRR